MIQDEQKYWWLTLWWKYNNNKHNWIIHRGIRFMFAEQNLTSTCFPMLLFPVMNSTEHPDLNWYTSRQRGFCPTTILLTAKPSTGSGPLPAPRYFVCFFFFAGAGMKTGNSLIQRTKVQQSVWDESGSSKCREKLWSGYKKVWYWKTLYEHLQWFEYPRRTTRRSLVLICRPEKCLMLSDDCQEKSGSKSVPTEDPERV